MEQMQVTCNCESKMCTELQYVQELKLLSGHSMQMHTLQFDAISNSIPVSRIEMRFKTKGRICIELQLMLEFDLFSDYSMQLQLRQFAAISSLIQTQQIDKDVQVENYFPLYQEIDDEIQILKA
jgi:hypothetical protein